jgi:hypothetical protein
MATLKIPKGPITIARGVHDGGEPAIVVTVSSQPRLHLGAKHRLPLQMKESDMKFEDTDFSPEGKAALLLVLKELDDKIHAKALEQAKVVASEAGLQLEM